MKQKNLTKTEVKKLKKRYFDTVIKIDEQGRNATLEALRDDLISQLVSYALIIAIGDITEIGEAQFAEQLQLKLEKKGDCLEIISNITEFKTKINGGFEKTIENLQVIVARVDKIEDLRSILILISFENRREKNGISIHMIDSVMQIII
ncbi:MAG: hypothetical protein GXP45_04880 [bacterium]|nr:hypothetical protein [bacterium]